jgi:hypothetical protein
MGLKAKLGKLQRAMLGKLDSFKLRDGTRFFFDRQEAFAQAFLFFSDSMKADHNGDPRPAPPDILQAIAGARDREDALSRALGGFSHLLPVYKDALVERGEFVPRELVVGRELGEPLEDLSE